MKIIDITITDIIKENPSIKKYINNDNYEYMMDKMDKRISLWMRVLKIKDTKSIIEEPFDKLRYQGYEIHNPLDVLKNILDVLMNHSGIETCQMCAYDVPVNQIMSVCGNCSNRICKSCISNWYGQTKIGNLVYKTQCACPFCKKNPKYSILSHFDFDLIRSKNMRPTKGNRGNVCAWDPNIIYGFCTSCYYFKEAIQRECTRDNLPEIKDWICNDCRNPYLILNNSKSKDDLLIKQCPNCNIEIEKTGGCNHITCPNCPAHWCWTCCSSEDSDGIPFDESSIYDHMADCGGIF
jgi:hypothetical protein